MIDGEYEDFEEDETDDMFADPEEELEDSDSDQEETDGEDYE